MNHTPPAIAMPAHTDGWLTPVEHYVESQLSLASEALAVIRRGGAVAPLDVWNDADIALQHAHQLMEALAEVHPDPEVRARCTALRLTVARARTERDADPELYAVMSGIELADDTPADARRARDLLLLDFRLEGAHLDADRRAQLADVSERLASATSRFDENIRESVGSIRVEPGALAGLPQDYVDAHPVGSDGLVTITTEYPDLAPFLDMASDASAREALVRADYERAYPANDAVLAEMLRLRDEKARLLGFAGWPDYATARMMMTDGAGIEEFLTRVNDAARPAGLADAAMLLARKQQDDPDATHLTVADSRYYIETLKAERHGVDAHEVRRYLDYSRVHDGILDLAGSLFGVEFDEDREAPSWHQDVRVYNVVDQGRTLGRIFLDMHPREGKYSHMACFPLVTGIRDRHLPEAALVCNFPRGAMTFDDLETFLHEFGHLMHCVLSGGIRFARLGGLSEVGEWDFVEAPSQLLEEWAYSHEVLSQFAVDAAGHAIPAALVDALRASRDFCAGLLTCRQLVYASLSYRLHRDVPDSLADAAAQIEREFDVRTPMDGTHQYASFGHLTTYSACYYTYQWSLSIAKDLLTGFDGDNLMDAAIARRYREKVLAPGGSAPAADLIEGFLGRPFSMEPYARWLASLVDA